MSMEDLPQSRASEEAVLGAVFADPKSVEDMADLSPADFSDPRYAELFSIIIALSATSRVIDAPTIRPLIQSKAVKDAFYQMLEASVTSYNVKQHVGIVLEQSRLRHATMSCQQAAVAFASPGADFDTVSGDLDASMTKLVVQGADDEPEDMEGLLPLAIASIENGEKGIDTGFTDLDSIIGGFMKGDMIVLAARPSMAKSAMGNALCMNAAKVNIHNATISLEMTAQQNVLRYLCVEGEVDSRNIRKGLSADEQKRFALASGVIAPLPIRIVDRDCYSMSAIRSKVRRAVREMGAELVIVDYLQLIPCSGRASQADQVGEHARAIKQLAKELGICIVLISQLNRGVQSRVDKRPTMSDLLDSGKIEAHADKILLMYSEMYNDPDTRGDAGPVEIIVAKNRTGGLGTARLSWEPTYTKFSDMSYTQAVQTGPMVTPQGAF